MRRAAILAVALPLAGCAAVTPAAALVDGVKVSEAAIEEELDRARDAPAFQELVRQQGDEARGQARREILTNYIALTIREQEARRMNIRVGASKVTDVIDGLRAQLGGPERFAQELRNSNLTVDRLRELARRQLVQEELQKAVTRDLKVDEAKIQAAYEQSKSEFTELHLARITVPAQDEARDVAAKASAPGADFADLAKRMSKDPSAQKGGDLGYVEVAGIDRALRAQLDSVPLGGIAGPVQGQAGFEIYKVIDRRTKPLDEVSATIADDLLARDRDEAFKEFMRERLRKARIVVNPKYGKFDRRALEVVVGPRGLPE